MSERCASPLLGIKGDECMDNWNSFLPNSAPAKAQTGAEISFNIGLSSHSSTHPPTPTHESIIQPQKSKIELHFQNKSYVPM